MLVTEHAQTALDFIEAADREFAMGDRLQGSEKLWGAASQAVIAIARRYGWSYGSHKALRDAVRRLAEEHDDHTLLMGFSVAEKLHANFYHGFMEDDQLLTDSAAIRRFVNQVLNL